MARKRPGPRPRITTGWRAPFCWLEWAMEWAVYYAGRIALFEFLEYLGKLSLVAAVITYFVEIPQRREQAEQSKKQTRYQAWQMINSAKGMSGDGGRREAIEELNKEGVELLGLSAENAYLSKVRIPKGKLRRASFRNADMQGADLTKADLKNCDFGNADLRDAKLMGAILIGADLLNAKFQGADLTGADLSGANLKNAVFQGTRGLSLEQVKTSDHWNLAILDKDFGRGAGLDLANLREADFKRADLRYTTLVGYVLNGANLSQANLKGVDLEGVDLQYANLNYASIGGAKLRGAKLQHAILSNVNRPVPPWMNQNEGTFMPSPQMAPQKSLDVQLVDLHGAQLQDASLSEADLQGADLSNADLARANLTSADLFNCNLRNANVDGTDFTYSQNLTPEQARTAMNWEKALWPTSIRKKLGLPKPSTRRIPAGQQLAPPAKVLPNSDDSDDESAPPPGIAPPDAPAMDKP